MTIRQDIQALKRDRILEEASRLFFERGYSGTSLDAIASRLKVTKPFIYYQFSSKAELLTEIYRRVVDISLEAIETSRKAPGSARDRLRSFVRRQTRISIDHQHIIAVFFREEMHVPEQHLAEINRLKGEFDGFLTALLTEGNESGEFSVVDPRLTSLAVSGMVSWVYTWYRPEGRLSPDAVADRIADLAVRMVERPQAGVPTPPAAP